MEDDVDELGEKFHGGTDAAKVILPEAPYANRFYGGSER
jgi:hypothetical protein